MRPPRRGLAAVALVALSLLAVAPSSCGGGDARPSILLVTLDTTRADRIGCYGYAAARTPALDGLAAEGALFEDAATPCPITLPAHATILTGLLPPKHGLRVNDPPAALGTRAARGYATTAEALAAAGYETAAFVSAAPLSARWGLHQGFGTYDAPDDGKPGELRLAEREGGETARRALAWLKLRDRKKPYFLWVHLFDPHQPYAAPDGSGLPPGSPAAYDEEIAYADRQVGRVLAALREEGTLDDTLVIATADHGEGLGDHGETTHGYFLYRSTLRVPLLVRWPDRVPAGTRVKEPVSLADLHATSLSAAGVSGPAGDGAPLVPLEGGRLPSAGAGRALSARQYAESFYGWWSFRWATACCLRDGPLKVVDAGGGTREAFDLSSDPAEATNLAPGRAAESDALAKQAREILSGRPAGAAPAGADPGAAAVPYVGGGSLPGPDDVAEKLPAASASFLVEFDAAVAALARAKAHPESDVATAGIAAARDAFELLARKLPDNPAPVFWAGRCWTEQARRNEGVAQPWKDAFQWYLRAFRMPRGYRDARTASLMMEACFHAGIREELFKVAELCVVEEKLDGDSAYWCWIAVAQLETGRRPDGSLLPAARATAQMALGKAKERARSAKEREHIAEIEAKAR